MLYTCTMNPSLDYYMEFDEALKADGANRSRLEYYEAGGKGINISIVLNNLGVPSSAFGFVGGFTKDFYISLLSRYENIRPNFTYTNGHTRINIKTSGPDGMELNATGPYITDKDMKNLMDKVDRLGKGDYLALAGMTQEYLENDVLEMLKAAIAEEVYVVLDTNPGLMRRVLEYHPFMIKTTPAELAEMLDETIESKEDVVAAMKKVKEHADLVMVLLNKEVALLCCEEGVYECNILKAYDAVSMVGTGDSMVAGFLMNYRRSRNTLDSFRFAASCGSATAYSKGLATREKIDSFYEETEIRKID